MTDTKETTNNEGTTNEENTNPSAEKTPSNTQKATPNGGGINLGDVDAPKPKKTTQKQLPPSSKKVKKGTRLGMKWVFILGGIFVIFLFVLLSLLFVIINNPQIGEGIGFSSDSIKDIAMSIAFLIFVPFFMLFLIASLVYVYRLFTSKVGKVKNSILLSLMIFLGMINLIVGIVTFIKILAIGEGNRFNTTDTLVRYIENIETDDGLPIEDSLYDWALIAPLRVSFSFNSDIYERYQRPKIEDGKIRENKLIIHCGNGEINPSLGTTTNEQIIEFTNFAFISQNKIFSSNNQTKMSDLKNNDKCLYTTKGQYYITLELEYEGVGGNYKTYELGKYEINVDSHIEFTKETKFTDDKSGYIIGNPDSAIVMDFGKVLGDLQIDNPEVEIDFDGDLKMDEQFSKTSYVSYKYNSPKIYDVRYNFLGTEYPVYHFEGIVEAGDKPTCEIIYEDKGNYFTFTAETASRNGSIDRYRYYVEDVEGGKEKTISDEKSMKYTFKEGNDYIVYLEIEDTVGDIGTCKTDKIVMSGKKDYEFDIKLVKEVGGEEETVTLTGDTITVRRLPSKYTFYIENITKDGVKVDESDEYSFGFDTKEDGKINIRKDSYETLIKTEDAETITAIVEDDKGNREEKTIKLEINLQNLVAQLDVDEPKGEVPFKVTFDASASELLDEEDEILKFIWDFGDGESIEQTREGIKEHTYKKEGRFEPKVTVVTANGEEDSATTNINALVGIKEIKIRFDSHPTGKAWEGERVIMSVETGGVGIKQIEWDFGDDTQYTCERSECYETVHVFEEEGNYKVEAKVSLSDNSPPSTGRKIIRVKNVE